ncbi:MAG: hypothetical protein R3F36_17140 [Candidatus Competibacteraceae bacterium]
MPSPFGLLPNLLAEHPVLFQFGATVGTLAKMHFDLPCFFRAQGAVRVPGEQEGRRFVRVQRRGVGGQGWRHDGDS